MEIVIAVATKIAGNIVGPVGQWLCYSCHYKSNMKNLKNQEMKLRHAKNRVQHAVEAASNNGYEIEDDVKTWLTKVDGILHQLATKKLDGGEEEAESRNSNASCLNLKQRHQISREAKKMVGNIAELLKNGNFNRVSYPLLQNMLPEQNEDYVPLGSRMLVMKRIMEALGDANINKIGVSGLAGVGKSTLMKAICRQAKEERLFNEVALAKVTDSPNLSRIQGEIADMLNLQFDSNETEIRRAERIRKRLQNDNEILVILEDIWKKLDLNAIGIPSKGCKLLLTSRDQRVLASHMGTEKNFELDILGEEEAWNLFEKMAGDSVKDDPDLRPLAIKVAKECAGLPIALVTVSRALKDHKNLRIWMDALLQLRRPTPEHDTEIWLPVYSCIELSYKLLVGKEVKSLFLLCARQGYYISYRDLLRYGFGLCLFHGIATLEEARNRLEILVSNLQDSCLLLQSPHSSEEFYMHDVVRHVATIIAANDHSMFVMRGNGGQTAWLDVDELKKCEALSILGGDHIHKYSNEIECPKLRYFHVQCKDRYLKTPSTTSFQGMDELEDIFFQGMDRLEVLSLTNIQLSSLLPLTNLQTLCLDRCKLGDIHEIGELKTLVILSLAYSDISNLPREIGLLTRLQLLDLSNCSKLRVIPRNVLSSLVNLEELYMQKINVEWGVEGPNNEGINASLAELKELSHLITIEIDIPDANNLPKDFLNEKFERYKICIGDIRDPFLLGEAAFSRMLKLKLNMSFQVDFGIKMLLERIEYLYLDELNTTKSVLYELDGEDFQQLKHFHIQNNVNKKLIPELKTPAVAFPILETFVLKDMISLEEICQDNLPLTSFKNLKILKVENCEKLRFIFSSSIAKGLSLLEELNIIRCNNMGAIFVKEEEDGIEDQGDMMLFGRLQTLVLKDLPKLMGFLSTKDSFMTDCRETNSEGNHDLQLPLLHHDQLSFPSLRKLHLEGLPKIKHVWSKEPQKMFRFQALHDIYVGKCESLTSLFPAWVVRCLEQLKKIEIYDCRVEEIVATEEGEVVARTLVFPRVTSLNLTNLQRLKWFYKEMHVSKWPMLKEMKIERCEEVEIFASGVVSFEETVEEIQSEMSIKQPLFLVDKLSFPSLETLHIRNMDKLEIIFGKLERQNGKEPQVSIFSRSGIEESEATTHFVSNVAFPSLKRLDMEGLPKIKHVWSEYPKTVFNFQNLQKIHAVRCESLKSLFPISVISCFKQLQVVEIKDCGVEEIVAVEGGGEEAVERTLVFPRVTNLNLISLKRLKWFYKGVHVTKWPMLKEMKIERCEKVEIFASRLVSYEETVEERQFVEMSIKQPLFYVDELSFPRLETLHIFWMVKLEIIWQDQVASSFFPRIQELSICHCEKLFKGKLSLTSFKNLKVLEVENYQKLRFVFSSSVARGLSLLEKLEIKRCNNMGVIVLREEKDEIEDGDVILFHRLQTLVLKDLPELMSFSSTKSSFMIDCGQIIAKGNHNLHMPLLHHQGKLALTSFKNLKVLEVENCQKLRFVFSSSIARGLSLLEKLEIKRCNNMGAIVMKEEKDEIEDGDVILFHQLQTLVLEDLPELVSFLSSKDSFMTDCGQIIAEGNRNLHMPLLHHQVSFPSLQTLRMEGLPKIKHVWNCDQEPKTDFRLQNLQKIYALRCESLKSLFPILVIRCLEQLQVLEIEDCGVEEIVAIERGGGEAIARTLVVPRVTTLKLINLKRLKWFYKGVDVSRWPMLKEMKIERCKKVEIFASRLVSSEETVEEGQYAEMSIKQPLFYVDELSFPSLETLHISWMVKLEIILQDQVIASSFPNIRELHISDCEKLFHVFPTSISMQSLIALEIYDCHSLEVIFGKLDRQIGKEPQVSIFSGSGTEENGATTHSVSTVAFPSLERLSMMNLPKIKHIWSEYPKTVFNFQNLQEIRARRCESLKSFFPTSIVSCLEQLKILWIDDCGVEAIVASGRGGEPIAQTLVFPRVTNLALTNLKRLEWFYKGVHVSKWPMLEKMCIEGCEKVEIFASGLESFQETIEKRQLGMSIKQPLFLVDEQSFSSLKRLIIRYMDKLEIIWQWQDQVAEISFSNIQDMQVDYRAKPLHVLI